MLLPFVLVGLLHVGLCLQQHLHDESFIPDASLLVSAKNISIGGINRYTTLVNGTVPGPELRLAEGRVTWIRVYNDIDDRNVTMHWHGISQAASPFSDGTPLASQWPIPPGHFFDYELQIANGSAGTYFYHSHIGFQSNTASGPLIVVENGAPPYATDGEQVIHIQELFNSTDTQAEQGVDATPIRWPGETNGFMINGKTISDWGVTDNSTTSLDVIQVEPEKTYRFRFIGATTLSLASFAFESHENLSVIAADGSYTKPTSTDFLQLGGGQRLDILFPAKSCAELKELGKLDYYFQIESRERTTVVTNYAILSYKDSCNWKNSSIPRLPTDSYPSKKPFQLPPTDNAFLDYKLSPLYPNDFPSSSEVTRRVIVNIQQVVNQWYEWRDSGIVWAEGNDTLPNVTTPATPYLVSLYENTTANLPNYDAAVANNGIDPKTKTFPARIGEVLEIVFQNVGSVTFDGETPGQLDAHPWHAHGKHYYDLGSGQGPWTADEMESKLAGTTPVQRDTTMLYRYNITTQANETVGWRAWRLRVEDPGVWMVHCHWLQHMLQGMQTVWVFGDAKDILTVPKPQVEGYLTYGGNVVGNDTHYPTVLHFSEL